MRGACSMGCVLLSEQAKCCAACLSSKLRLSSLDTVMLQPVHLLVMHMTSNAYAQLQHSARPHTLPADAASLR